MRNKKYTIIFILCFVLVLCESIVITFLPIGTDNKITDYEAFIDVDSKGNINIRETVVMDYSSYDNYFNREISYYKENDGSFDNRSQFGTVNSVRCYRGDIINNPDEAKDITDKVTIAYSFKGDGLYKTESGTYRLISGKYSEIVCIDAIDTKERLDDKMTYIYEYELYNMATVYNDIAELQFNLLDNRNSYDIKYAKITISFPNAIKDDSLKLFGNNTFNETIVYENNNSVTLYVSNLSSGKDLGFRALFSTDILDKTEYNYVDNEVYDKFINLETKELNKLNFGSSLSKVLVILSYVTIGVLAIVSIYVYFKYDKEVDSSFNKDKITIAPYDYSPAIVSYLVHKEVVDCKDMVGVLLDLIRRKYLSYKIIDETDNYKEANYILEKTDLDTIDLKPFEKRVLDLYINKIGNGNSVTLKDIEEYGKKEETGMAFLNESQEFIKEVKSEAMEYNFYEDLKKKKLKISYIIFLPVLVFIGFIFIKATYHEKYLAYIFGMLFISFIFCVYLGLFKRRTLDGAEHYARWIAYRNYLNETNSHNDVNIEDLDYWDTNLVYSVALSTPTALLKQLKVKANKVNGRYPNSYYMYYGYYRIYNSCYTCNNNVSSSTGSHGGSSGHSSGGGGFSGGR